MVTDRIIKKLEEGVIPWEKQWVGVDSYAISYTSRKPYSFLNQLLLGEPGEYLTFRQCKELGGNIKKGAKSKFVVFFTFVEDKNVTCKDENGKEYHSFYPILKYYNVFHISDCEGIESKVVKQPAREFVPIEEAERIISDYVGREDGFIYQITESNRAYYSPMQDKVVVPLKSQFVNEAAFYSVSFHELTHSTAKESRCDRPEAIKMVAFGSEDYSREELVAEMSAAMLVNHCGIDCSKAFEDSVAYIQAWLKALKNDNKMLVWAASRAEKAAKYILGIKDDNNSNKNQ